MRDVHLVWWGGVERSENRKEEEPLVRFSWKKRQNSNKLSTNLYRFRDVRGQLLAKAMLKSAMKKSSLDTCDWRTSSSRILCNKYTIFKYYIFKYIFKYYIFKIFFLISVCFFHPPVTAVSSVHFLIPKSMLTLGSHHRRLSMFIILKICWLWHLFWQPTNNFLLLLNGKTHGLGRWR